MITVLTITIFIFTLGLMILVHECGHFLTARLVGIKVEEFSIGIGPVIKSWIKNKTRYSLRLFPIGGFVRMFGEENMDIREKGSFGSKTPWQRLLVVLAGVFMNFVLVVIIGYIMGFVLNFQYRVPIIFGKKVILGQEVEKPVVTKIADGSPADELGIKVNDVIDKLNGEEVTSLDSFIDNVALLKGQEISLTLMSLYSESRRTVNITPRAEYPEDEGPIGIELSSIGIIRYPGFMQIGSGFFHTINLVVYNFVALAELIEISWQEKTILPLSNNVAGPIGLFYIIREAIKIGAVSGILDIICVIGISLFIVNLLPIPALDGGYVIFLLVEGISGKRLPGKVLNWITQAGMTFLLFLIVLVAVQDIVRFTAIKEFLCRFNVFC